VSIQTARGAAIVHPFVVSHLSNPTLPQGVLSPRNVREKMRKRILDVLGPTYSEFVVESHVYYL
jgi:hypothetical protein